MIEGGVQFQRHPIKDLDDFAKWCVPVGIHGDATPAMGVGKSWAKMMDIWSWHSLLVKSQSQLTMFLILCVHSVLRSVESGQNTLDTAFKKMRWSFDACWEGRHPKLDWNNRKLRSSKASLKSDMVSVLK